jgi:membrane-bound serine protease (ClpP class)
MKKTWLFILIMLSPFLINAQKVLSISIDGTINPASASYIKRGIKKAEEENARCLIIYLNTPGGLLKSTRVIVGDMLDSRVPVVVYVYPGGAHAGSAGVFITMAAHIAAMAPATNIGAAHPVAQGGAMDSTMNEKATNDAVAFIRTIAEKRNRNAEWAEQAVRRSVSITGDVAVNDSVVDMIAISTKHLLQKINGRVVELPSGPVTLQTANATEEALPMSFVEKLLNIISDPNFAYILMMIGLYGLLFELYNPGAIFPGVVGVISLVLGLYALHSLPVNYAGLALIIFGVILLILEIKIISHGLLTVGGIISLLLGSLMLIKEDPSFPLLKISLTLIITTVGLSVLFFAFIIGAGIRAQKARPVTGMEQLIGETGIVLSALNPLGSVRVHGEIWEAESLAGKIEVGKQIRVLAMNRFRLSVEPSTNP